MPYRPNEAMRKNARRALEFRKTLPPSRKFGTPVGLARARDIANNVALSQDTILRMRSYLARARDSHDMYLGESDPEKRGSGYWSYLLWGGVSAIAWVEDKIRKYRKAGEL
jgi:hypothetical protein